MKRIWMIILMLMLLMPIAAAETPAPVCPELLLAGNPTTGYSWTWEVQSDGEVVNIDGEYVAPAQTENPDGQMLVGAGGKYRIVLRGVGEGDATIILTYARPWETKEPLYTLICQVHVDADLNVTILHTSFDW